MEICIPIETKYKKDTSQVMIAADSLVRYLEAERRCRLVGEQPDRADEVEYIINTIEDIIKRIRKTSL